MDKYDIIVIGAGHAGIEAALASSRMGCLTLLVTLKKDTIGLMSCNPAIGGVGKGQLVKEIDALGGQIARAADSCAVQFRTLNSSKGPAVQSTRAQEDRKLYQRYMENIVLSQDNLTVKEKEVIALMIEDRKVIGVECLGETLYSKSVVIATGTFLSGVIHLGLEEYQAGRINEPASMKLSKSLKDIGLELGRLKTCTTARIDGKSIDFSQMKIQPSDLNTAPFSFSTKQILLPQLPCYLTYTDEKTHQVIRLALKDKKLFHIISQGVNPRYCPSIEEKIMRFPEKVRHQLFIEPEGLDTQEYYTNGLFTFLPRQVQTDLIHTITGLEKAQISKFGYGIEYDFVYPTQLYPTLETKSIRNLYLAGQINGTTGYEEAAAQGLAAGINAALRVKDKEPLILDRASSYIGVLIDDLTTKGTDEPYRMFTSRVEYRLILRQDNADLRLNKIGYDLGLISKEKYLETETKIEAIRRGIDILKNTHLRPTLKVNRQLERIETKPIKKAITLEEILRRPGITLEKLKNLDHIKLDIPEIVCPQIEIEVKYFAFIQRQLAEVARFKNLEKIKLPLDLDYSNIPSLSCEIKEKLNRFKPINLGQASRISGVTPVAISILMVYLRKLN
jgi:tRNA uridine 5-carboxymethylaminomethyl modification enzyme